MQRTAINLFYLTQIANPPLSPLNSQAVLLVPRIHQRMQRNTASSLMIQRSPLHLLQSALGAPSRLQTSTYHRLEGSWTTTLCLNLLKVPFIYRRSKDKKVEDMLTGDKIPQGTLLPDKTVGRINITRDIQTLSDETQGKITHISYMESLTIRRS